MGRKGYCLLPRGFIGREGARGERYEGAIGGASFEIARGRCAECVKYVKRGCAESEGAQDEDEHSDIGGGRMMSTEVVRLSGRCGSQVIPRLRFTRGARAPRRLSMRSAMGVTAFWWLTGLGWPAAGAAQTPERAELLAIAREVVSGAPFVSLATVDEIGHPAVRAMDAIPPDDNWVVWLATNPASRKVEQLRAEPRVALHYLDADGASYVTLIGRMRLVDEPAMKARHWKESWTPFYPDRDESALLIEVTPIRLEVVSAGRGAPGDAETWRAHIVEFGPSR